MTKEKQIRIFFAGFIGEQVYYAGAADNICTAEVIGVYKDCVKLRSTNNHVFLWTDFCDVFTTYEGIVAHIEKVKKLREENQKEWKNRK